MRYTYLKDRLALEDGKIYIYIQGGDIKVPLPDDRVFNGSSIGKDMKRATCLSCGNRHAPGLKCAKCARDREHKNKKKPDNIKGT